MTHLNEKGEKDERGDKKQDETQMKKVTYRAIFLKY